MNRLPTLRNLVACNKVELAIQKFIEWAPVNCSGHEDEGVMLAYRYASARGNSHTGTISWEVRMQEEKNVVADFMELLQTCEREQNDLAADDPPGESAAGGNQKRAVVEIVIEGDLPDFPSRRQKLFIVLLALVLDIDFQKILIKKMEKGSIILTLEIPLDSALNLQALFEENAPNLRPLLDEFTVLQTPQLLNPEPAQPWPRFPFGRQKARAAAKINSLRDFGDIIVAHGEEYAMNQLYQQSFHPLKLRLKNRYSGYLSNEDIEDVLSDAFVKLMLLVQSGRVLSTESGSFFGLLFKLADDNARNMTRKNKRAKMTDEHQEPLDLNSEPEEQIDIREAFSRLSERHQQLLTLYYYENKSDKEIAQILNYKDEHVVREMRHRIMKKLRDFFNK